MIFFAFFYVILYFVLECFFFFFKQKTAYEMRISDWSSDVCSSELAFLGVQAAVIALIVRAVHRIGEHILVDRWLWAIAIVAALASAAGVAFWITLPAAGGVYALWMLKRGRLALLVAAGAVALAAAMALWAPRAQPLVEAVVQGEASLLLIFVAGLKAGLLTFGGAYTAIPRSEEHTSELQSLMRNSYA